MASQFAIELLGVAAVIASITLAGCALPSGLPATPPPMEASTGMQVPLKLCASPDVPPTAIAEKPDYAEYAVSVTDALENPVRGLKQPDFEVYRDQTPLRVEFFRGDNTPAPVAIAVVLDSSGSMTSKLGTSNSSRLNMVRDSIGQVVGKLDACDEVALITFGGRSGAAESVTFAANADEAKTIRVVQSFTTQHSLLKSRLDDVHPYGQTPLYDSIHDALGLLAKADYPQRAMIVITDGMDNVSVVRLDDLLSEAVRSGVPIYTIGMGDPNSKGSGQTFAVGPFVISGDSDQVDADVLKQIAKSTGGESFIVSPADKDTGAALAAALAKINAQLASEYTIGVIAGGGIPNIAIRNVPDGKVRALLINAAPR